jgi:hypothetical protein
MKIHFLKIILPIPFLFACFGYGQQIGAEKNNRIPVDLSHWKITIPEENPNNPGNPIEVGFPEIVDYEVRRELIRAKKKDNRSIKVRNQTFL